MLHFFTSYPWSLHCPYVCAPQIIHNIHCQEYLTFYFMIHFSMIKVFRWQTAYILAFIGIQDRLTLPLLSFLIMSTVLAYWWQKEESLLICVHALCPIHDDINHTIVADKYTSCGCCCISLFPMPRVPPAAVISLGWSRDSCHCITSSDQCCAAGKVAA